MSSNSAQSQQMSQSNSSPLSAGDVSSYYDTLNNLSGGRLGTYAQSGSAPVSYPTTNSNLTYQPLTPQQIQAEGGLGATQKLTLDQAREQAIEQTAADPSYSQYQKARANQLTNRDYAQQSGAVDQQTEAAITNLSADQAAKAYDSQTANRDFNANQANLGYQANVRNAGLSAADLVNLAQIYFSGKGQKSSSLGGSYSNSSGVGI